MTEFKMDLGKGRRYRVVEADDGTKTILSIIPILPLWKYFYKILKVKLKSNQVLTPMYTESIEKETK